MSGRPIHRALREQARACADLGSPFTARLLAILAEALAPDMPLAPRLLAWDGSPSEAMPLRLAGALHALVLSGQAPALAVAYPPHEVSDAALRAAVTAALHAHAEPIDRFLDSPPQTNEVARSATLIVAAHWLHAHIPLPVQLSELGASAGLNLPFDRYALEAGATRLGPT